MEEQKENTKYFHIRDAIGHPIVTAAWNSYGIHDGNVLLVQWQYSAWNPRSEFPPTEEKGQDMARRRLEQSARSFKMIDVPGLSEIEKQIRDHLILHLMQRDTTAKVTKEEK